MTSMSDFFGGLNSGNIRFTDARINGDGPLPTSLSGPEGINGDPDGRYNFNDALLSGILPYAGPKAGRMGSDRNYQQIPHRKQYPVPKIYLPEPAWNTDQVFDMSHPIDMGDIVFIVNCNHKQFLLEGKLMAQTHAADNTMPNYNAFVNVCTVNYLLKGISVYVREYVCNNDRNFFSDAKEKHAWYRLLFCLGLDTELERMRTQYIAMASHEKKMFLWGNLKLMLQSVIRDHIKPYGVCSTSEKQGGQHETGYKPVQAAASFYVTLTVDGQNRDVVNIWRGVDVKGGDFLILQLNFVKCPKKYVLNHYYKGYIQRAPPVSSANSSDIDFQLVPGVNSSAFRDEGENQNHYFYENMTSVFGFDVTDTADKISCEQLYDNRVNGYWHVGQAYSMKQKFDSDSVPHDDMAMTRGPIMQINFAPVWQGRQQDFTQILFKHLDSKSSMESCVNTLLKSGSQNLVSKFQYGKVLCDLHSSTYKSKFQTFDDVLKQFETKGDEQSLEFDGTPASSAVASGPTEASMSLNLGTEQRFKKARVDGAQQDGAADSVVVAPVNLTKESADADKNAGWDFEADLAAIFKETGEESAGGKITKKKTTKNP